MKGRWKHFTHLDSIRVKREDSRLAKPDLRNPTLMLHIEKVCSKGPFTTQAKSHLDTAKFFLEKETNFTALQKLFFRLLNPAAVRGCSECVVMRW